MKKFLSVIFLSFFFLVHLEVFGLNTESNNAFEIDLREVPPGGGVTPRSGDGISSGAVTAITLSSVFGGLGLISGVGYYFYKHSQNLRCGLVCGRNNPYQTIQLNDNTLYNKLILDKDANYYILKAFAKKTDDTLNTIFLVIPDTEILSNTYNTVFFELPYNNISSNIEFTIIQVSKELKNEDNLPSLDSNLFFDPHGKGVSQIPTFIQEMDVSGGILIKKGQFKHLTNRIFSINTQYNTMSKKELKNRYAIIVEFKYLIENKNR